MTEAKQESSSERGRRPRRRRPAKPNPAPAPNPAPNQNLPGETEPSNVLSRPQGSGSAEDPAGTAGTAGTAGKGKGKGKSTGRAAFRPASPERLAKRQAALPAITYPEQLPVSARREEIAAAIANHQVVIVAGETGSGKTTQIPKICLELGRGIAGTIGHTQPRRIAARTVAERIAEELGVELGGAVGYQVRFTDQVSDTTLVKLMTDGILLAEIQRDPLLRHYDTIIVDEAHERSLNIDFILGYLHQLLPQRPDLKVIITSATIDSARFAEHFAMPDGGPSVPQASGSEAEVLQAEALKAEVLKAAPPKPGLRPAPVVEVSGRTYPVEIRYRPLVPDLDTEDVPADDSRLGEAAAGQPPARSGKGRAPESPAARAGREAAQAEETLDQTTAICLAADELLAEGQGDILVFCSGEREIRDTADALAEHLGPRYVTSGSREARASAHAANAVEVVPLYARLSSAEQHRVFEHHTTRRIVLATNVAETSLTVPGIRYVIDPGTARISRYSNRTKVQRLPIEPVSQASANQRAGRCGRVADGICIRLYSRRDFEGRPEFTEPEILRTSLASVILQMTALGLGDVAKFGFVDAPDSRSVKDGMQLLHELNALEPRADGTNHLTKVGRSLAQLPIDPRLGRMMVEAGRLGCVAEVLVIVAGLSVQDVRERPTEHQQAADEKHRRFADPTSDFLSLLKLWDYLREQQRDLSSSAYRRMCKSEFLNYLRVREWQDVHAQLRQMAKPLGLEVRPRGDATDPDRVHQALLAGLLSHIGAWDERRREFAGARGTRLTIFPGSHLAKKPPTWVMAAELVETSRLFARTVARIQPEWAEPLAAHLVKRTYSEPHWSTKQGAAMVKEKVLLYGVPLVAERTVPFARVDPLVAREMFIRHALVQGEWRTHHTFFAANTALLEEAASLEARSRRRDLVIDEDGLFDFYDERVPDSVTTARHFDAWWKDARREHPDLLTFTRELLVPEADTLDAAAFPDTWRQADLTLPLSYQFEPGTQADGVTCHIPISVLNRVRPDGFDWMVPGLIDELAVATIRSLPKPVRVQLVPAPDVAREVVGLLPAWGEVAPADDGAPSFADAFASAARALRGVEIGEDDWAPDRLPAHLRMTFQVHSERGAVLAEGKDLVLLQRQLARESNDAVRSAVRQALTDAGISRDGRSAPSPATAARRTGSGAAAGAGEVGSGVVSGMAEIREVTAWPELPDSKDGAIARTVTSVGAGGLEIRGYPALAVEEGAKGQRTVALRVLADADAQAPSHRAGVLRLLYVGAALAVPRVSSRWTGGQALTLASSPYSSTEALVEDVQIAAIARRVAGRDLALVRDAAAFASLLAEVRAGHEDEVLRVAELVVDILTRSRELEATVKATTSMALLNVLTDVRDQHASLVRAGFVAHTAPEQLVHLPRYLRAAVVRLEKAAENPRRDADLAWRLGELQDAWWAAQRSAVHADSGRKARLDAVRWMLEELRVSFFAQQLGTPTPISEKRIRKALAEI